VNLWFMRIKQTSRESERNEPITIGAKNLLKV